MKKKLFTLISAALIGGSLIVSGCSFDDLTEEPKVLEEVEEDSNDIEDEKNQEEEDTQEAEEIVEMTVVEQLALIDSLEYQWMPFDEDGYTKSVSITDFDEDGRLEVVAVSSVLAEAISTEFRIFEVDNAGTGLIEMEIDFNYSESMPNLLLNTFITCAVSNESNNTIAYVLKDSVYYGYGSNEERKFVMSFEDNKVKIEKIAYAAFTDDSGVYYGRSDNITSADAYANAENTYFNASISGAYRYEYQSCDFISVSGDVSVNELVAVYEMFARYSSIDEYYGNTDTASRDEYPLGWMPSGYSGEERYSALGSISMKNTTQGMLEQYMWQAVEIHDADSVYMYDYRDEIDRLDSCLLTFGYDGNGYYTDGFGGTKAFSYELYSTQFFTNIALTFDDGSYAYAFSYDLYIEGEATARNCLIISLDREEIYFVQCVD